MEKAKPERPICRLAPGQSKPKENTLMKLNQPAEKYAMQIPELLTQKVMCVAQATVPDFLIAPVGTNQAKRQCLCECVNFRTMTTDNRSNYTRSAQQLEKRNRTRAEPKPEM